MPSPIWLHGRLVILASSAMAIVVSGTAMAQSQYNNQRQQRTAAPRSSNMQGISRNPGDPNYLPPDAKVVSERVEVGEPTKTTIRDASGQIHEGSDLNTGNLLIKDAAKRATSTKLDDVGLSEVIAMCEEGLKSQATPPNAAYAKKLMGWAHNRRGERLAETGSEEMALEEFNASVKSDPTAWRPMHNRGVSYARLNKPQEAMADFNRVLEMHQAYPNTWFNRGELRAQQQDFSGALSDYNEALRLNGREPQYYASRGLALYRLGRIRESMADFNNAVRMNPRDAHALVARGDAYREQGDYSRAATDYRTAMQVNPKFGRGYQAAAWLMVTCPEERFRNAELGLNTAKKAIELDGDEDYRYSETLAAALANMGQYDTAKEIAKTALAKVPEAQVVRYKARVGAFDASQPYREGQTAQVTTPDSTQEAQSSRPTDVR